MVFPANETKGWDRATRTWSSLTMRRPLLHDPSVAPNGVVYQFQDDMLDSSGNGRNLTVDTGTERYTDLFPGIRGFYFDALTRLVFNTTGTALQETGDVTVGMIVRFDNISSTSVTQFIYGYGSNGDGSSASNVLHSLILEDQQTKWFHETGTGSNILYAIPQRPTLYQVAHLGATRISNVVQIYMNGLPFGPASSALTAPTGGTTGVLYLGANVETAVAGFGKFAVSSFFIEPGTGFSSETMLSLYQNTIGRYDREL